ncbi:class I SAM-dependent methyltransferase [Vibrio salinus]|uniref:class I SAM-dependent methyltransferase n=1 Tax=Vibrio salinus TaxID=2899784 RepID=UPI001E648302|nr:class I SAM-dependent methyltransferase [Vibrio salinus]MCE0494752.1 class I SAM-dependent methyltransferase [Vibrio salinus]
MSAERHPLQQYWDLYGAGIKAKSLDIALEKKLFDFLYDYQSVAVIAVKMAFDAGMVEPWLTLLWSMNCLDRKKIDSRGFMYKRSELAEKHLCHSSDECCIDSLRFRYRTLSLSVSSLELGLKGLIYNPAKQTQTSVQEGWAAAAEKQIKQEQKNVSSHVLTELLPELPFRSEPESCLDIGGGAGFLLKSLADYFPQTRTTLFDFPATVNVAKENLCNSLCYDRFEFISGDINHDVIPGHYDFILCSSVFHFIRDLPALILNMWEILNPGGMILVLHSELTDSKEETAQVLPFYLPMKTRKLYVPQQNDIISRFMTMKDSRHVITKLLPGAPMAPLWAHGFVKEGRR